MENLSKILKGVTALISLIGVYFFIQIIVKGDDIIVQEGGAGIVGPFVYYAVVLLILIAVVAVLFSILGLLKKPEVLKKTLLSIVFFLIVIGVSYGIASDEIVTDALGQALKVEGQILTENEARSLSKNVGMGVWTTLSLGLIAILMIIAGGVKSLIK